MRPATEDEARKIWLQEGYDLTRQQIERLGCSETPEGGFHFLIEESDGIKRVMYQGPGEFVRPHSHHKKETSIITFGSAHLWRWNDCWNYELIKKTSAEDTAIIEIDANVPHCLIASDCGLSMYRLYKHGEAAPKQNMRPDLPLPTQFKAMIL